MKRRGYNKYILKQGEGKMPIMKVDHEKCIRCGECVEVCPFGAAAMEEEQVVIGSGCRLCGTCEMSCPAEAITFEKDA